MTDRDKPSLCPETLAASIGVATDIAFGAVAPPLYLTSTYEFAGFDQARQYDYGRAGNPTRDLLAEALTALEGGAGAVITSSGMAALDLLVGRLRPDDLVLAPHDCYGGTMRLLKARASRGHCSVRFVDQSNETELGDALEEVPTLVLIETPSNPLMRVVDIATIATKAKNAGASIAVDNTFLSPAL
ncbi:PLP-dependent transferase, partial [Novosphingobium sp. KN65.2]|uniref:PLP-dependent transferase n=1 Tax=Novosphingobium sp. KN65.2 TaxID=1478134 RepID=UPI000B0AE99B